MDKALDDSISSRRGSDRRPARGASRGEGSGRSTPTSARTPYQRPAQRSTEDAWTHDMYGGAGNAPKVVHVPRSDAVDKTRLLITNVHYEVTVDDLKYDRSISSRVHILPSGFLCPSSSCYLPMNLDIVYTQYDRSGRSTGIVNLQYSTPREARDAINSFDGNLAKGQALSIKFDDTPFVSRPPRREGFAPRQTSTGGDLLSRISGVGAPSAGAERNGGGRGGNRGREGGDVPRGLTRGYRRGGPARGQGVRGGRNSERKEDANADDLDKDLEAYLKAPAADEVRVKDGDVDMS
ncbi:hypothetical protein QFC22_002772 [Naganishia vaughanmartiniae]|uniref:Uncharacterized protein n=1 Tax=Naganishia vaughanmartiniae TaxID=1424756 RepID=A0ACC2XAM6_9TREE|nr:hypothetical protein QFC22_002772 [Naganishia vaughanmartiniae]